MQILTDIDAVDYKYIKNGCIVPIKIDNHIYDAIRNGTPLKGHGRLGDLGKIYVELNEAQIEGTEEYKGLGKAKQIVCDAKTIIEADKAESEEEDE